jgi:hypothetical protein
MYIIATTRFNNETWEENKKWREKHDWDGCIYGAPVKISEDIPGYSALFILEMNNDKNKIEGIGLIYNRLYYDNSYRIYADRNYNRYTYKSKYRISRENLSTEEETIMKKFDVLLFTGSRHLKRGQGITSVPRYILKNKDNFNYKKYFKHLFIQHFGPQNILY